MKRVLASVLVLLCMVAVQSTAGTPFEGKVVYKITTHGESINMTVYAKEKKSKMEMNMRGQNMSMIMDWSVQKMYMVMDEQKMVMSMSLDAMEGAKVKNQHGKKSGDKVDKLEKTGKTKTILGYSCEQWIAHGDDGEVIELWGSSEVGSFSGFMNQGPMAGKFDFPDMEKFAGMENMFPMMVSAKDKSGKEIIRMEATTIEKKSLAASLFTVPSGYKLMEMPKGMGKMMHGGDGDK